MTIAATALMFHGLDGPASARAAFAADAHYTWSASRFRDLLRGLAAAGIRAGAARDLIDRPDRQPQAWLTFDDGDASNHAEALPALVDAGVNADFFVNPARVGRPGFMDWMQIRDLSTVGMSIQSHGHTHRYFTALTPSELREELRVSKAMLEDRLGRAVTLLAPPGGRAPAGLVPLAASLGYRAVLGSVPGQVHRRDVQRPLPRLAVLAETPVDAVLGWLSPGAPGLRRLVWRHRVLAGAKIALGDERYERWRGRWLGAAA